ncbi:MAG: DUF192 domain-containing protein [Armatimonadetes bacterium]|nr:DUF192 domain-containing protein [Armatimonadota bacterium]
MVLVTNVSRGTVVAHQCVLGVSFGWRLRGLMFRRGFGPFDGLWLAPTAEIHMFWVRFPIDLVWLDAELRVVDVTPAIAPWRVKTCRGAASVLELPVGTLANSRTQAGDQLVFGALPA